jgi:hypothetical protein
MPRGFGQKTGDQWTVPICFAHHHQIHTCGKGEKQFWKDLDIDAESIACTLYQHHLDQKKSLATQTIDIYILARGDLIWQ